MTSFDQRRQGGGGRTAGPLQQQGGQGMPQQSGGQQGQGLPPTGIQQQLNSLNQSYQAAQGGYGMRKAGVDIRQEQFNQAQGSPGQGALQGQRMGSTSLDQLGRQLAQSYGLSIGRGQLVDENGNMLMTPDQIAGASGGSETLGSAAVKLQYISQAIAKQQNEQAQKQGLAAIQTGLGQVQSRGRGSLAAMQSGMYQDMADLYANKQYEAADFSYFVQKEQQDIALHIQARQEKLARRQARAGVITGVAMMAAGNYVSGGAMVAGNAGGTGWF